MSHGRPVGVRFPSMLVADGLSVHFGGRAILDRVDFTLSANEIAVIDGPSGGGKSTLLRALATLQALHSGRITLDGVPATEIDPPTYRARVAYVPQSPAMFAGSVGDNVRAGPRLRGIELADAEVDRLLEQVALSPSLVPRSARELSGGEKQRVAIARAIAQRPRAILFDEPTSALDPTSSATILELVRACATDGLGVVVVTHAREHASVLEGTRYVCRGGKLERGGLA